jgi:Succinylglutamate desuccinylase / Aspartoacylase family
MNFGIKTFHSEQTLKACEEHLLGRFIGDESGPTLIVTGSVHGNEASGTTAIKRILPRLESSKDRLKGRVYLLAGNTRALKNAVRFIDTDLNRHWTKENISNNLPDSPVSPKLSEDVEQRELLKIFNEILSTAQAEVYALDLHSTSADGVPFGTVGDTLRNRDFAQKFPITFLLGIEEQLDGTILEYLNNLGAVTLGFEGGQHVAESTIDTQEAMIWLAHVNSGNLKRSDVPDIERQQQILKKATGKSRILEIRYRHPVQVEDEFEMRQGFQNFQPIDRGQILAKDKNGEIKSGEKGLILMPLYQKLGEDGFFIGREISPFWLSVSRLLRKLKIGDLIHFLPGVRKDPTEYGSFIVNTQVARFFPLQIFHLLGFRKRRWRGDKLIVSRRAHDTVSPFK